MMDALSVPAIDSDSLGAAIGLLLSGLLSSSGGVMYPTGIKLSCTE